MNNHEEKDFHKNKKAEKGYANNFIEKIIHDELFIMKCSNKKCNRKT